DNPGHATGRIGCDSGLFPNVEVTDSLLVRSNLRFLIREWFSEQAALPLGDDFVTNIEPTGVNECPPNEHHKANEDHHDQEHLLFHLFSSIFVEVNQD
ncbi:MAG: hypothetical protein MUP45_01505, partial [Candidatus Marinimicrobia bacterium]|nr:hypothetical protein [Candidatus Neomarinimicrobiota bacterium]